MTKPMRIHPLENGIFVKALDQDWAGVVANVRLYHGDKNRGRYFDTPARVKRIWGTMGKNLNADVEWLIGNDVDGADRPKDSVGITRIKGVWGTIEQRRQALACALWTRHPRLDVHRIIDDLVPLCEELAAIETPSIDRAKVVDPAWTAPKGRKGRRS